MTQVPIITKTPLTNHWVCITKWRRMKSGLIIAKQSFDVGNQIRDIIAEAVAAERRRQKRYAARKITKPEAGR